MSNTLRDEVERKMRQLAWKNNSYEWRTDDKFFMLSSDDAVDVAVEMVRRWGHVARCICCFQCLAIDEGDKEGWKGEFKHHRLAHPATVRDQFCAPPEEKP